MNLKKLMRWCKIIFVFTLILISILILSILIQFPSTRTNLFNYLGIVQPIDRCRGSIELYSSCLSKCTIEARIITDGCKGKDYQIRENSCSGTISCQDIVAYDSFQTTCVWTAYSGYYNYVLCVDNIQKSSNKVKCCE